MLMLNANANDNNKKDNMNENKSVWIMYELTSEIYFLMSGSN